MNDCEQWNLEGDCRKCRKLSYCSKECKKHKNAVDRAIKELVAEKMAERFGGNKNDDN